MMFWLKQTTNLWSQYLRSHLFLLQKITKNVLTTEEWYIFKVLYKPGKSIIIADFVSRAPLQETQNSTDKEALIFQSEIVQINVLKNINLTDKILIVMQKETKL